MGIEEDWSFEEDFLRARNIPLHAYDGSVSGWDFFIKFYTKIALFEPINAKDAFVLTRRFLGFFNGKNRIHHRLFVGRPPDQRGIAFETILARDVGPDATNIFFKIDIEGGEYAILDDLIAHAERIEGLVIELHDVDRTMTRITNFIAAFPLTLCHVHANNFSLVLDDGTPTVIECSFTRHPAGTASDAVLPHPLDMPCNAGLPDIALTFAD